jgi:glycosyltransferase involved in cell wall biosynthesis
MKILIIHSYLFKTGGDWTYIQKLNKLLTTNGFTVSLFGISDYKTSYQYPNKSVKSQIYFESNKKYSIINKIKISINTIFNIKVFYHLVLHLYKFRPEIIQLNSIHTSLSPSVLFAIFLFKPKKIVWRVLDYKIICPNRTLMNHKNNDCTKCVGKIFPINAVIDRCKNNSVFQSILISLENFIFNCFIKSNFIDSFHVQSEFSANLIEQSGVSKSKIKILNNPFEMDNNHQLNYDYSKSYDMIYFGRLSAEKGLNFLIETINQTNFKIIIIGDGPLKDFIVEASIKNSNIFYGGVIWGEDLKKYICQSSFTIIPSIWNEVSPYVLLESYNCGVPVLCSNSGGTKDLVLDGVTGKIFISHDEQDLINKINFILFNYNDFKKDKIRNFLKEKSSFEKYLNLFNLDLHGK